MKWIEIKEDNSNVPPKKRLLVKYEEVRHNQKTTLKEYRTMWGIAEFWSKYSHNEEDNGCEIEWDIEDLDEKDGQLYLPEGWYEEYDYEDKLILMKNKVTHFMEVIL